MIRKALFRTKNHYKQKRSVNFQSYEQKGKAKNFKWKNLNEGTQDLGIQGQRIYFLLLFEVIGDRNFSEKIEIKNS